MGLLIDTSVLIDRERGRIVLDDFVTGRGEVACFLSVISVSELLHGVHRADTSARRARLSGFVESIIDRFPILPIDLPSARVHAELWAGLIARGRLIGAHDLWLSAVCLAHDLTLVTSNFRDFARVPGLPVEDWTN